MGYNRLIIGVLLLLVLSCQANKEKEPEDISNENEESKTESPKSIFDLSIEHIEFGISKDSLIVVYLTNEIEGTFKDEFRIDIIGAGTQKADVILELNHVKNPLVLSIEDFPENDFSQLIKMTEMGMPPSAILLWSNDFEDRAVFSVSDGLVALGWFEFNNFDKLDKMDLKDNSDKEFYLRLKSLEQYEGEIDSNGYKQGIFTWRYQNGSIRAAGEYKDDKLMSLEHYDINGKLRFSLQYDVDQNNYLKSEYNKEGVLVYQNFLTQ